MLACRQWCKGFPAIPAAVVSLLDFQGRPAPSVSAKVPGPLPVHHTCEDKKLEIKLKLAACLLELQFRSTKQSEEESD